jgi:hypothetical protein
VACFDDPLNFYKAMRSKDPSKWEATMEEEYDSLMENIMWKLTNLLKDCKCVGCK